jgi:hypothetical protein
MRCDNNDRRGHPVLRAAIEIGFIIFLFYAHRVMGEYTASRGQGKALATALSDIVTGKNFAIALISAFIGYIAFEYLRKKC